MNSPRAIFLSLIAVLIICFSFGAQLQSEFALLSFNRSLQNDFFANLLDDSRTLFANSAFVTADEYYHSGFYPTMFDDNHAFETPHMAEDTGAVASRNSGDEAAFMGPPRDWIDAFGRHFIPNRHTHLDEGGPTDDLSDSKKVAEILPWLKLSAELNPEDVRTYTVIAFWLRTRLNQTAGAEQILREGLRSNPGNPQLLFELGRIYFENYHNISQARNIWQAALRSWRAEGNGVPEEKRLELSNENFENRFIFEQLQTNLAKLEESAGNWSAAIADWQQAEKASPNPASIQKHIQELQKKSAVH